MTTENNESLKNFKFFLKCFFLSLINNFVTSGLYNKIESWTLPFKRLVNFN